MTRARHLLNRLAGDDRGATAVEYGLILALIALAAFGAFSGLGDSVNGSWGNLANDVVAAS